VIYRILSYGYFHTSLAIKVTLPFSSLWPHPKGDHLVWPHSTFAMYTNGRC